MAFSELVGAILFRLGVARLGARVVVAITVAGFHDFDDEIGHVHFDVEFDEISEGVELDIAGVVSEEILRGEMTYTMSLGRDIMAIRRIWRRVSINEFVSVDGRLTSIVMETAIIPKLYRNKRVYLVRPFAISLDRTRWIK